MSQVHLHRLYIVPVLQREDGKGVTQIMYSCVRCADFLRNLFEVQVDAFWLQMISEFAHKSPYELEALATMDYVANSILPKGSSDKKIIEKFTEIKGNKFPPEMIQTTIQELRSLQYIA